MICSSKQVTGWAEAVKRLTKKINDLEPQVV